ncbi:rhodopsin kinase GRK7 [Tachyglossus aculeatus]|uniref:rhodopsin kinase GRK7 n=1 Tax=Tachyglossus aculeatus TaxID=9261 RepID=UPI0018F71B75|nr:rhodopsin kinase GRK7 [Tachyglossus aculeatus]
MVDMGGLDNLIANTAYLQARKPCDGDSKEMQKRRRSLALPGRDHCTTLRQALPSDFDSLCERQPIGRRLFHEFLATVPAYQQAADFLGEVSTWELAEEGEPKESRLRALLADCSRAGAPEGPLPFLSAKLAGQSSTAPAVEGPAMVALAKAETLAFLRNKPFQAFQASPFFDQFLQWKVFEQQPVTDKYFYEFRVLGKGGFGEVCAIQVKNTGKMYACKKLDKKRLKKKSGEKMALLEKEILEKVNSPFIVTLAYAYQSKTHLCLVMSLMTGGDLKYHIYHVGEPGLEPARVLFYSAQIACGILHLHSIRIVYRDMKPENVLLDDRGNCRLSDLGLAVQIRDGQTVMQRAGTNGYMAPEILREEESYSYPVDWFAMGCSIYEMVAGRTPFKDFKEKISKEELKKRTLEDEVKFNHPGFTEEAKDICGLFLAKKPEQRLGSRCPDDDPRKHAFFRTINFSRLEAGLVEPPFVPNPSVVYAKDVADIADFSEIRGIEFDDEDKKFFQKFATGAVPVAWQEEIIETGLFEELSNPSRAASCANGDGARSGVCALL